MAKAKEAAPAAKEKKVRVKKVDTGEARENLVVINTTVVGKTTTTTRAMPIRTVGVMVETTVQEGDKLSVSSVFIPGVKVKTKKLWKFLTVDKGPKPKKEKKATKK